MSKKKPWLKEECGYAVFCTMSDIGSRKADAKYAEEILSCLCSHNLIHTPEGVAIWLAAMDLPMQIKFPGVWQHNSPLHIREKAALGKIMKESSEPQADAANHKNSGVWNPKLHFAWAVILPRWYKEGPSTFADFFVEVVDSKYRVSQF
jgi:DNA polymerase phi